jgi:hypothetical protein
LWAIAQNTASGVWSLQSRDADGLDLHDIGLRWLRRHVWVDFGSFGVSQGAVTYCIMDYGCVEFVGFFVRSVVRRTRFRMGNAVLS